MNKRFRQLTTDIFKTIAGVVFCIAVLILITFLLFIAPEPTSDIFTLIGLLIASACALVITMRKLKIALDRGRKTRHSKLPVGHNSGEAIKYKNVTYGFTPKI